MASGMAAVPIPWSSSPRQVRHILEDTDACRLVTTSDALRRVGALTAACQPVLADSLEEVAAIDPVAMRDDDLALILYTSGSTGAPRGVMASHGNLWASVGPVVRYLRLTAHDRLASLLPFSFTYGLGQLTCAIAAGAELVVIDPTIPLDAVDAIGAHRCTVLAAIPPTWLQFLRTGRLGALADLRVATCAGGRLSPDSVVALRRVVPHALLFLMYGFTEVFRSAWLSPDEVDQHPDAMGRPIEGARVELLDEASRPVAGEQVGELVHAGPTVTLGYWRDAEATSRRYLTLPAPDGDGPPQRAARSGDFVRRSADGLLYFIGRKDHLIKTLGIRVSPDEVVDALLSSSLVREAAVTGEPDALRGQRIVAHVVLREGATIDAIRRATARLLPRHMHPARWVEHQQLPRTAAGKYDLTRLWEGDYPLP